jgi:hypothetical protein
VATGTPWRTAVVPAGITLEQHSAAAQHLVAEFLAECAEAEWRLTSRPRLTIKREEPVALELWGGDVITLPSVNRWTVEADASR